MLIGVAANAVVPERAFICVSSSVATLGAIWGWPVIILCHLIYRRRLARGQVSRSWFRLPFATPLSLLVIAFLAFLTVILGVDPDNRIALYTIPLWAGILIGGYLLAKPGMAAREAAATAALQQTQATAVAGV